MRRARAPVSGFSGAAGGVGVRLVRGLGASRSTRRRTRSWSTRSAGRSPRRRRADDARAAPGRARDPRDGRAPRPPAFAPGADAIELRPAWRPRRRRSGSTTSPRARATMRDLLGGKGANVAEMTRILGADRVPAGFTITTEACVAYMSADRRSPTASTSRSPRRCARLEEQAGKRLGDDDDPLLVSVRSRRARVDAGHARHRPEPRPQRRVGRGPRRARPSNERFAWDSYRRFVQMFGNVVTGIAGERFEDEIKRRQGRPRRQARHRARRRRAARAHRRPSRASTTSRPTRSEQLERRDPRRVRLVAWATAPCSYRRINRIPDDWGTAVNVQQMVFGNKGDTSRLGRRVQPRRGDRRARAVRRLPRQRPGRGRRLAACATRSTSRELTRAACPRPTRS